MSPDCGDWPWDTQPRWHSQNKTSHCRFSQEKQLQVTVNGSISNISLGTHTLIWHAFGAITFSFDVVLILCICLLQIYWNQPFYDQGPAKISWYKYTLISTDETGYSASSWILTQVHLVTCLVCLWLSFSTDYRITLLEGLMLQTFQMIGSSLTVQSPKAFLFIYRKMVVSCDPDEAA